MTSSPQPVDDEVLQPLVLHRGGFPWRGSGRSMAVVAAGLVASYGRTWLFFVILAFLLALALAALARPNRLEVSGGALTITNRLGTSRIVPFDELGQPVIIRSRRWGKTGDVLVLRTRTAHVLTLDASWGHEDVAKLATYLDAAEIRSDEKAVLDEVYPGAMSWGHRHRTAIVLAYVGSLIALALLAYWAWENHPEALGWPW